MPDNPARTADAPATRFHPLRLLLPLLGALGIAALWVLLGLSLDRLLPAIAVVAPLDLVLMVRLARLPRGSTRGWIAAIGTALAIALALWWSLAARVGVLMGMMPWEGISLMGPGFAWTLAQLANDGRDLAIYIAAVLLAAWFGR